MLFHPAYAVPKELKIELLAISVIDRHFPPSDKLYEMENLPPLES